MYRKTVQVHNIQISAQKMVIEDSMLIIIRIKFVERL